jgi:hypothetical protein
LALKKFSPQITAEADSLNWLQEPAVLYKATGPLPSYWPKYWRICYWLCDAFFTDFATNFYWLCYPFLPTLWRILYWLCDAFLPTLWRILYWLCDAFLPTLWRILLTVTHFYWLWRIFTDSDAFLCTDCDAFMLTLWRICYWLCDAFVTDFVTHFH